MSSIDELANKIEAHLASLPSRSAGNKAIRTAIGATESDYWEAHKIVADDRGSAVRGRGKGGSLALSVPSPVVTAPASPTIPSTAGLPTDEAGWYAILEPEILGDWKSERGLDEHVVEITARQGSRNTGGKWTRPDITVVGLRKVKYVQHDVFEVWTFEVKRARDLDVSAVYEALGHARAATHAVVIACFDTAPTEADELILEPVLAEAERHGVGLYVVTFPGKFDDWDLRNRPERLPASMDVLDGFIATQLPSVAPTIGKWFGR